MFFGLFFSFSFAFVGGRRPSRMWAEVWAFSQTEIAGPLGTSHLVGRVEAVSRTPDVPSGVLVGIGEAAILSL